MLFNPSKVTEKDSVFKVHPELSKRKIFKKSPGTGINNELVMLFIMCMYDKSTPYRNKYPDILKRKIEVANDVGFKIDSHGEFDPPVEDFLKGKNKVVNEKIVEFVRIHRNFKYTYLVTIEQAYYSLMLESLTDPTVNSMKKMKDIQLELEETLMELINDDNNPHLNDTVLRYVEEKRLGLRPEDVALKLKNNEQPFPHKKV
jgi:hypothetical protein